MEALKEFRLEKTLSKDRMARKIGVSTSFFEKVENGHAKPSRGFMEKLKSVYPEVNLDKMFFSDLQKVGDI